MTPPRSPRRWPLLLIAASAASAVWSGWVGLGAMAGFGIVHPLPGIWPSLQLNTAITLPVGVEAYGAYALGAWLGPAQVPAAARTFARRSAIGALALGILGQVTYHLLAAAHVTVAPWPVVVLVSCMPVVTLGFGAALTHLLRDGKSSSEEGHAMALESQPDSAMPEPAAEPSMALVEVPAAEPFVAPEPEPATRAGRPSQDPDAEKARAAYRKSLRAKKPLSDRALGEMFDRSRTWGASRIRECQDGPKLAEAK